MCINCQRSTKNENKPSGGSPIKHITKKPDVRKISIVHLAKSNILKSSPKYTCYITNITSDVSRMSIIFAGFTYFPRDVSEAHTSLHTTELQLILRYGITLTEKLRTGLFNTKHFKSQFIVLKVVKQLIF